MQFQTNLFSTPVKPETLFNCGGVEGLVYKPALLGPEESTAVLAQVDRLPWREDLKRRVQHYGYRYDYKRRTVDRSMKIEDMPDFARDIAASLLKEGLIAEMPDQLIVNEYQPGQGITAHIDCQPCFKDGIVTVSLGWAYEMDFLHSETREARSLLLGVGSALILNGPARYEWLHAIRSRKSDQGKPRGRRVSLTYRNVLLT